MEKGCETYIVISSFFPLRRNIGGGEIMKKKSSVIGVSTIISVLILMQASMVYAAPIGIIDFAKFPAYPYNTAAYMVGGAYVGCGPTTGAMIFAYFQHHFGLTGLLTNPGAGVNEGLNTAWALHGASYMNTGNDGFGSVYDIKPGLENYAADRGFQVKVMAHAATDEDPLTSWYNDYGPYGVAWTNDGNFWLHPGGVWNIDPNLFCDFVGAKLSQGIPIFLTVDSAPPEGGDHWIPLVGYDKAAGRYYYYNTYDTTLRNAPIAYYERTPGSGDYAISFVRTVEYIPSGYSAAIWAFAENEGWMDWVPITKDGVPTGQTTPYTFTGLTGTHTFTVPSTEPMGRVFYEWSTGWTGTTLTVNSAGTYTARYRQPGKVNTQIVFALSPNPAKPGQTVTLSGTLKTAGGSAVYPATVKVEYSTNGGTSWNFIWNLNTNAAGQFSQSFPAPGVGSYLVRVSYAGSANYNPSSQTQTLVVQTGVTWTYNFRMSPATDVVHFNLKGSVIYGIAENSVGAYPYSNAPVIGYVDGGTFYLWIDGPDKTAPFFELVMMVGSVSTGKGNVYQTMDGTSWNGPTAYTLVPVAPAQSYTSDQALASLLTDKLESWPATLHYRLNPFVDVVHLSIDGQLIHGTCDAITYHNLPVLGWMSSGKYYFTIDYTKNDDGSEIFYELGMNIVSVSTLAGSMYRTVDGKSVVGPTAVTLTSVPP
jgi:hypothetical protein